jgi:hypothetical protein
LSDTFPMCSITFVNPLMFIHIYKKIDLGLPQPP